jgi:hypothetical protein
VKGGFVVSVVVQCGVQGGVLLGAPGIQARVQASNTLGTSDRVLEQGCRHAMATGKNPWPCLVLKARAPKRFRKLKFAADEVVRRCNERAFNQEPDLELGVDLAWADRCEASFRKQQEILAYKKQDTP